MEIRQHAVLYALIAKEVSEAFEKEEAEDLIRKITTEYGRQRGKRMGDHSLKKDMNDFFINGEWKGKDKENISKLFFYSDSTESHVYKCAWYDAWKQYGLLEYGPYYCRYIDKAICEGFDGSFDLEVPSAIGLGDEECIFIWSEKADPELIDSSEKKYILPFDFHCKELYECAGRSLSDDLMKKIKDEFAKIFKDELSLDESYLR